MNVAEWLNAKFLEWERNEGKRKTMVQFAEYLGVAQPSLSAWATGKYVPKGQNLAKIAEKLGYEIYDVLGIPRPMPAELDEKINDLIQAARQFPPEIQAHVIAAFRELIPLLMERRITDEDQIMWMLADMLRKRVDPDLNPDKLASQITGFPRIVYPIGVGFRFDRTPENIQRFKLTGMDAARKIDELGLDEDSQQGQAVILQVFLDAGFPLLDMNDINISDAPDGQ